MGKIITFANQKGGSGKTTLAANLAVLWSNSGYKVAVIDADAQKSLAYWHGARKKYYGNDDTGIDVYPYSTSTIIDRNCRVYAISYYVLRLMSGMGGLAYN